VSQYIFLSYVSEDRPAAMRLATHLRSFGIHVWTDRDGLRAGDRWREEISRGIEGGAAFLACFSANSEARTRTYMRAEVLLAIDELRRRSNASRWFIPILLDGTRPADLPIGGGASLGDIQYIDMSYNWDQGIKGIVATLLTEHAPAERARLEGELRIAKAMERLATASSEILSEPIRAVSAISAVDHVSTERSTAFIDLLLEKMAGHTAILELEDPANRFGATHLPAMPLAISTEPAVVAWASRSGSIAVGSLSDPGIAHELGTFGDAGPDLFIDRAAHVLIAIYFQDRRLLRWDRVGAFNWERSNDLHSMDWKSLVGPVTNRYSCWGGSLHAISSEGDQLVIVEFPSGRETTRNFGVQTDLPAMSPHTGMIVSTDRESLFVHEVDTAFQPIAEVRHDLDSIRDQLGPAARGSNFAPHGICVDATDRALLNFTNVAAVMRSPRTPTVDRSTVTAVRGWSATLLPSRQSAAYIEEHPRGWMVQVQSQQGQTRTLLRVGAPSEGFRWTQTDAGGNSLAVVDERGRVSVSTFPGGVDRTGGDRHLSLKHRVPIEHIAVASEDLVVHAISRSELRCTRVSRFESPQQVGVLRLESSPELEVKDVVIGNAYVAATQVGGGHIRRVFWPRTPGTGVPCQEPAFVSETSHTSAEISAMNPGVRFDAQDPVAVWQVGPGKLVVVDLESCAVTRTLEFPPHRRGQREWDLSVRDDAVVVFGFTLPVLVWRLSTGEQRGELTSTGGGMGGAWGDWPADVRVIDGTIMAVKRAGSIARWRASDLSRLTRPLLAQSTSGFNRVFALPGSHRGQTDIAMSDYKGGLWVLRNIQSEDSTDLRHFVGTGAALGVGSAQDLYVRHDDGTIEVFDLAPDAGQRRLRSLADRSVFAESASEDD